MERYFDIKILNTDSNNIVGICNNEIEWNLEYTSCPAKIYGLGYEVGEIVNVYTNEFKEEVNICHDYNTYNEFLVDNIDTSIIVDHKFSEKQKIEIYDLKNGKYFYNNSIVLDYLCAWGNSGFCEIENNKIVSIKCTVYWES